MKRTKEVNVLTCKQHDHIVIHFLSNVKRFIVIVFRDTV